MSFRVFGIFMVIIAVARLGASAPTPDVDVKADIDENGTLTVLGASDNRDEKVQISHVGDKILVVGFGGTRIEGASSKSFDANKVKAIYVNLGRGDNEYKIDGTGSTSSMNPELTIVHGASEEEDGDGRNKIVVKKWRATSIQVEDEDELLSRDAEPDNIILMDIESPTIEIEDGIGDDNYTIRRVNGATVRITELPVDSAERNTMAIEGEAKLVPDGLLEFTPCEEED